MPRPGWIKLYHSLLDNPMWQKKPFSEGQAWVDLLLLAETTEHDFEAGGETRQQTPGCVYISKFALMDRWGWTQWKIDHVFPDWEKQGLIHYKTQKKKGTVITIVNWGKFQRKSGANQKINQEKNHKYLKNNIKKGGDGGSSPRLAQEYEKVKINGRWVMRPK